MSKYLWSNDPKFRYCLPLKNTSKTKVCEIIAFQIERKYREDYFVLIKLVLMVIMQYS